MFNNPSEPGPVRPPITPVSDESHILMTVAAFFELNGRWASPMSENPEEREAGVWLARQRVDFASGRLDVFRREMLDHRVPGWAGSREDNWLDRARDVADFFLRHGRAPSPHALSPEERLPGLWLMMQLAARLSEERIQWLDSYCPQWNRR